MRLWSLHPANLDTKGLVALWREGLLAQAVLEGQTKGYRNHPQLERFLNAANPVQAIGCYLWHVGHEGIRRGYNFDIAKVASSRPYFLSVTQGQLDWEWGHLKAKLAKRAPDWLFGLHEHPTPHPMFGWYVVPGPVEKWEKGAV